MRQHRTEVSRLQHGSKGFSARDPVAARNLSGTRSRLIGGQQPGCPRLGEVPGNQPLLFDDQIGQTLLGGRRNYRTFEQGTDNREVHIEREGGGRTALGEFFGRQGVVEQPDALSAHLSGNIEAVESIPAQGRIVFQRMAGFLIVRRGSGGEVCCQPPAALLEVCAFFADLKIHDRPPSVQI